MGAERSRDLILAATEFAFVLDSSKGNININVGPYKTPLSDNDTPIVWDNNSQTFTRLQDVSMAIQQYTRAEEGVYIVLNNPARGDNAHPPKANSTLMAELDWGRKINIPGPVSFPLWPGQSAEKIDGHQLKFNQYLLVRIYNEKEAAANWKTAVVKKPVGSEDDEIEGAKKEAANSEKKDGRKKNENENSKSLKSPDSFIMGQLIVVKGTEVSFFIPPTGVEVLCDDAGKYVRNAVTLESLEYCILLDENGNKRYERGPAVVFPKPTEHFIEEKGSKKFKAYELTEICGIYVKVIAAYEEGGKKHEAGEEMFITGKDQTIYFPRAEHAVIKYGHSEIIYAVAVPGGEGRYVLDRLKGKVELVEGPTMLLPDPSSHVIIRRVLTQQQVKLWFPGNETALKINRDLTELASLQKTSDYVANSLQESDITVRSAFGERARESFMPDEIRRSTSFTAPRTVTLDTKYEGAVTLEVWDGYAVLVTSKTGKRRVEVGPKSIQLAYDETLQPLELSTGTPKDDNRTIKTAYLLVHNNKVSDRVTAETSDFCNVSITLSYRVNFEGNDKNKWFSVDNYVKFLTEHLRSRIRNVVKHHGIEEFYQNAIDIIRDNILGKQEEGNPRVGLNFSENAMRVYDIEVLNVEISDSAITNLLVSAQHETVKRTLQISSEEQTLDYVKRSEEIKRKTLEAKQETKDATVAIQIEDIQATWEVNMEQIKVDAEKSSIKQKNNFEAQVAEATSVDEIDKIKLESEQKKQEKLDKIQEAKLNRKEKKRLKSLELVKKSEDQRLTLTKEEITQELAKIAEETTQYVKRMESVDTKLIAAMQAFGDKALMGKMAETMAPLAILGGNSIVDVVAKLFNGTPLAGLITMLKDEKVEK